MTDADILERLTEVVRRTFRGAEQAVIGPETPADDVPGWDSLNHALFIMQVESAFGVQFDVEDVIDLENVGALVRLVARLQGAAA
jgi:acyl carrier protein